MSVHKSLSFKRGGSGHRNVLSREERIAKLEDEGRWTEERSVFGLQKVRSIKPSAGKKAAKKKDVVAEAVEGAPAEGEAAEAAAEGVEAGGEKARGEKPRGGSGKGGKK